MRRIVLIGTGTGVGKTFVAVALAQALHRRFGDEPILALKPIETGRGVDPAHPFEDAAALERACVHVKPPVSHPCLGFDAPLSPHLAARMAGADIRLDDLVAWIARAENRAQEDAAEAGHSGKGFCLIETAGAFLSPLGANLTNLDLARALEPAAWLLVAPDALGVLHDVSAAMLALRTLARPPNALVLCAAREPDASTGTNRAELQRLGIAHPSAALARGDRQGIDAVVDVLLGSL